MTVKELIEELSKMPENMAVMAQDGLNPSDWNHVKSIRQEKINPICYPTKIVVLIEAL